MMDDFFRAEVALLLARQGLLPDAEAALCLLEPTEETWSSPEVLRIKGAIAEVNGNLAAAEARYLDAVAVAERQGALFRQLRAATSLAALWVGQGRAAAAQATLAPAYERLSSVRQWSDLRRAADCLEACHRALTTAADLLDDDGPSEPRGAASDTDRPAAAFDA